MKTLKMIFHWKFFLILVVILLVVSAIFRALTPLQVVPPKTSFATTNFDKSTTSFQSATYTGENKEFPQKLSIAAADTTEKQDVLQTLVDHYNFKLAYEDENNIWESTTDPTVSLTKDDISGRYTLLKTTSAIPAGQRKNILNKDALLAQASDFMKNIFPDLDISPNVSSLTYYEVDEHIDASTPDKANAIGVFFDYKIDDFPIFFEHTASHPFEIFVDKDLGVLRITFYPFAVSYKKVSDANRISLETAVKNINQNKASVVGIKTGTYQFNLNQVSNLVLTDVSLEYRLDDVSKLLYPFYRFTGTGIINGDKEAELEVITPAIQTQN